MAERQFSFAFTREELREAVRFVTAQAARRGRPRLRRLLLIAALLAGALLFGFVMGPIELGPLSFDHEMSIAAISFLSAMAGVLGERIAFAVGFRRILAPWRTRLRTERTLTVSPAGIQERAGARTLGLCWSPVLHVRRGARVLVVVTEAGEWLGLPLRLLPDPGAAAALEQAIAGWRTAA